MPLHDDLVLYMRVWTAQPCLACGAEFQFLRRYRVDRRDMDRDATVPGVEAMYVQGAKETAEPFPCPHCGYVQPDMIGNQRAFRHGAVAFGGFLLLLVNTLATAFNLLTREGGAAAAFILVAAGLVFHLYLVFSNPNGHRAQNLDEAKELTNAGQLRLVKPGEAAAGNPPVPWPKSAHIHATGFSLLAIAAIYAGGVGVINLWLGLVAGMVLFVVSGSAFGNIALTLKKLVGPREIVEVKTTQVTDGSVPEDFQNK